MLIPRLLASWVTGDDKAPNGEEAVYSGASTSYRLRAVRKGEAKPLDDENRITVWMISSLEILEWNGLCSYMSNEIVAPAFLKSQPA